MLSIAPKMLTFTEVGNVQELELTWSPDEATRQRAENEKLKLLYRLRVNDKQTLTMSATHGVLSLGGKDGRKSRESVTIKMRCEEQQYLPRCIILIQWLVGDASLFGDMSSALVAKTFVAHSTEVKYGVVHCSSKNHSPLKAPRVRLESLNSSGASDFGTHNPATPRVMTRNVSETESESAPPPGVPRLRLGQQLSNTTSTSSTPVAAPPAPAAEEHIHRPAPRRIYEDDEKIASETSAGTTDDTVAPKDDSPTLGQRFAGFLMSVAALYLLNKQHIPNLQTS